MEKDVKISLLLDFYGPLLSEKKYRAVELYYNADLSLFEIAEQFGMTRQGVRDLISRGARALTEFEAQLGLYKRFTDMQAGLSQISRSAEQIKGLASDRSVIELAERIERTAERLSEQEASNGI